MLLASSRTTTTTCRRRRGGERDGAGKEDAEDERRPLPVVGGGASVTAQRSGRRCQEGARARWIYAAAARISAAGDGNRPAAAGFRGGAGAGEGKFPAVGFSRVRRALPRAVADAPHMALRIVQNAARSKKFSAPRRLPRLLERPFSSRARYTGGFFAARPI